MAPLSQHSRAKRAWALAKAQHGVIARFQLLALGYSVDAVRHRVAIGRLHPVYRGVYAVGRADLTRKGEWMAAVLACRPTGALSHQTAAALWGICPERRRTIHVSVIARADRRHQGVVVHRRSALRPEDVTRRDRIPVTTPVLTLIDLATCLTTPALEAAINEADNQDLVSPPRLRKAIDARRGQQGVGALRAVLDRATFVLTDSELERRFLPIAARAGLPRSRTQEKVNGFRVDFFWPELGLVVETDGLRYHRTAEEQARDRLRDQAHTAAGLAALRFTHRQVRHDPRHVERILRATASRLGAGAPGIKPS
jgi:very-short-patch-repair endonuclease/predicted transcriptional regulator of viral defense system